jgi:2-keto-3-deoxy-L-rhamnonate aldolase RhmA
VFSEALKAVSDAARRHGVVAGVHASAALAHKRMEQGFTMITIGVDQAVLAEALKQGLDVARETARVLARDEDM